MPPIMVGAPGADIARMTEDAGTTFADGSRLLGERRAGIERQTLRMSKVEIVYRLPSQRRWASVHSDPERLCSIIPPSSVTQASLHSSSLSTF